MEGRTEFVILRNLLYNEEYVRKVVPFIESKYFELEEEKKVFVLIVSFFVKYDKCATAEALLLDVKNLRDITQETTDKILDILKRLMIH